MKSLMFAVALAVASPVLAAGPTPQFTTDTPIEQLVANPAAKAVVDADFPGLTSHAMYDMFKGMSLTQLAPMSEGKITPEILAKAKVDLAKIK